MNKTAFVVDAHLGAVRLADLHKVRDRLRSDNSLAPARNSPVDVPVLTGNQGLKINQLYPASNSSSVRYYLPAYQLATSSAGPSVELRYDGEDGESVGRLTIDFSWKPPDAGDLQLRVMEHTVDLELHYQLPVEGSASAAASEVVSLQPLQIAKDGAAQSVTLFSDKTEFDSVYQAMRDEGRKARLFLQYSANVGVKTWRQIPIGQAGNIKNQTAVLKRKGALLTNVLSKAALSGIRGTALTAAPARVAVREDDADEAARVRAVRTVIAQPRLLRHPTVRVRASRPAASSAATRRRVVARPAKPSAASVVRSALPAASVVSALRTAHVSAAVPVLARAQPSPAAAVASSASARGRVVTAARATAAATPVLTSATLTRVNAPKLKAAVASSDLLIKNIKAVPLKLALTPRGEPAIVDTELECSAELPFTFDPRTQSSVYATETFQTSGIHLLLPRTLTDESGRINRVVYQDNLMPDVIHVAPTEYRLARSPESPFLPSLSMLCADFGTEAGEGEAEVLFNVVCSYELEPWLDPETIELARAELAAEGHTARFTPIVPREAKLSLDIDFLGDDQNRSEAEIETSVGISDTLMLDHNSFTRLWRERLAQQGAGITGKVAYQLFDGTPAQSRVVLSLWETSADVFDVEPLGVAEGGNGRLRVRIRNRIESETEVVRLPEERLSSEAVAVPVDAASVIGRRLKPQEFIDIDYQLTPPDAVAESFDPIVFGRVHPNLNALLKLFMLNSGYSSLSFALTVSAADGVFGPAAAGSEPLIGLLVEFDDGSQAQLTPEDPESEVTLVGRLIDQLLGEQDDQQRYFYRVTNLHASGEGARTSWKEGQGSDPLQVGSAVVQLDF